jgi:hypothetical protein
MGCSKTRPDTPAVAQPNVVIPPRASAAPSTDGADNLNPRDRYVRFIAETGRMAWQRATGYGWRNLVETAIGRYKHLIGPKLRARMQQGEATIAVAPLTRMIRIAKLLSLRRA